MICVVLLCRQLFAGLIENGIYATCCLDFLYAVGRFRTLRAESFNRFVRVSPDKIFYGLNTGARDVLAAHFLLDNAMVAVAIDFEQAEKFGHLFEG